VLGEKKRLTTSNALVALQKQSADYLSLMRHGSLHIEIYRPQEKDRQTVHDLDEIYVVISGSGYFVRDQDRQPFEVGEILFVPAGTAHKFEEFTEDFATWIFFFGPEGGERDTWLSP
jgi:mannose-6-phosphate isomerase-like protein (cupin superfamily)